MAEQDNFALTTFHASWKAYQEHIKEALSLLTAEQLALRAKPHLRSIGEIALHIIGCRLYWFTEFMGEASEALEPYASWNEAALSPGAHVPPVAELVQALDHTWQYMTDCLARWSSADMRQTFPDEVDGEPVEVSRAWVIWHVLEHDLHHGGELSLTLGIHGISANFPG